MTTDRDLAARAIAGGLLDDDALSGAQGSDMRDAVDGIVAPAGYQLVRLLGRGGCGVVYLAEDERLRRPVALKFLTDARPSDVERLRREARYAARLDDPAIVRVYELGESAGAPFIAMQFVEGADLSQAGLEWREVVRALETVANALHHAHGMGVVHRDIKPENILRDAAGRIYLTDFGIARDVRAEHGDTLSGEGVVIGTPALMPPEQARGMLQSIDGRSDVYSLGATAYQLLAGRPPFRGASIIDLLHAVVHADPPLLRAARPELPRELEAVVLRCMQKDRSARFQSAAEVASALAASLEDTPAAAAPNVWFRRLVGAPDAPRGPDTEVERWRMSAEIQAEIAAWDTEMLRVSRDIRRTFPRLERLIERLDAQLASRPDAAWARFYRGMAHARLGRLEIALDDMERSIDRASDVGTAQFELGRVHLALYLREHHRAQSHIEASGTTHHLQDTRSHLERAVAAFAEAERRATTLPAWQLGFAHAVAALSAGDTSACIAACDSLIEADPDVAEVWKLRGDAERTGGRDPVESYLQAADVRRSFHEAHHARAEALLDRDDLGGAAAAIDAALAVHPEYVPSLALRAGLALRTFEARVAESGNAIGPADWEALAAGINEATRALALDPRHYTATITKAELQRASATASGDDAWLDRALETLASAVGLPGCQNRVKLLTAQTHLSRAKHRRAAGLDSATDLAAIRALRDEGRPIASPFPQVWLDVFDAADALAGG